MMKPALAFGALLLSFSAVAQSQFRQRIRHLEARGEVWLLDDGGVVSKFFCNSDSEQALADGGSWPLKNRYVDVDGGTPNSVLNTCARNIEAANALDGGLL